MTSEPFRRLDVLVGEWGLGRSAEEASSLKAPATTFAWELDGTLLVQRTTIASPPRADMPNATMIITVDPRSGGYTQYYFDSRGIARTYRMSFDGVTWSLVRDRADFTPLDFSQRFSGRLVRGGRDRIEGTWERSSDGKSWAKDFAIFYVRR